MFYIYLYHVTVYMCGTMCIPDALRGQERASDTLELELQIVVSHHVNAGPKPGSSESTTNVLNC